MEDGEDQIMRCYPFEKDFRTCWLGRFKGNKGLENTYSQLMQFTQKQEQEELEVKDGFDWLE